ncbi:O-glycosyl hydrolase [Pedobacter sp. UYP24]
MQHKSLTNTLFLLITAALFINSAASGQDKQISLNIDLTKTYQTINNFGASDAWACQFVGNWPDEKKNKIADLLFSNDNFPDGSPKGIGLSMWRFNIGAGSTEQGKESGIRDEWRRAESFLNADGSYNWEKQSGQIWFLKAAKERKVNQFLAFTNSPPVNYTVNGKAFSSNGKVNIAASRYDDFATFLVKVISGVEKISKIKFNYLSPVNEPQWDWSDGTQEGSPYLNTEIAGVTGAINRAFVSEKVKTKLIIAEAGSVEYLIRDGDKHGTGSQINDFFKPGGQNYVGNLPSVAHTITGHSYFSTSPTELSTRARKAIAEGISKIPGLNYWQSEYCILGDNAGEIKGRGRDLGIDAALYLATVIHTDLTVANATAWQWWTALSPYNYKDGLIYLDKNKVEGNFYASKMLWALGNYSRFIKPGAVRIDVKASGTQSKNQVLASAFKKGKSISIVLINPNAEDLTADIHIIGGKMKLVSANLTSSTSDLKLEEIPKDKIVIPHRSILTLTGIIKK